jgi:hypothetical protein
VIYIGPRAAAGLLLAALACVGTGLYLRREAYLDAVAADARRRGVDPGTVTRPDTWPLELYEHKLRRIRDPAQAEELVEADSVRYFVRPLYGDSAVHQVFFFHVGRRRSTLVAAYDLSTHGTNLDTPERPPDPALYWPKDAALSWMRRRLGARRAAALGMADSLERVIARIPGAEVEFWEAGGRWSFTDTPHLRSAFTRFDHLAVRRLIDCADDPRPSATRLYGERPVPVGALCLGYLDWLTYREMGEREDGPWAGEPNPHATPEQLKAARAAWEEVYRTRAYRLQ